MVVYNNNKDKAIEDDSGFDPSYIVNYDFLVFNPIGWDGLRVTSRENNVGGKVFPHNYI